MIFTNVIHEKGYNSLSYSFLFKFTFIFKQNGALKLVGEDECFRGFI